MWDSRWARVIYTREFGGLWAKGSYNCDLVTQLVPSKSGLAGKLKWHATFKICDLNTYIFMQFKKWPGNPKETHLEPKAWWHKPWLVSDLPAVCTITNTFLCNNQKAYLGHLALVEHIKSIYCTSWHMLVIINNQASRVIMNIATNSKFAVIDQRWASIYQVDTYTVVPTF